MLRLIVRNESMGTQAIAQWLIDNPQAWFNLAELIAEKNPDYARQLAQAFEDQFWNYKE